MIKLFSRTVNNDKILKDSVVEIEEITHDNFFKVISTICEGLDLSTPVVLDKHYKQMMKFNHCEFLANEFLESVDFKKFIVEIIDDKKDNTMNFDFDY